MMNIDNGYEIRDEIEELFKEAEEERYGPEEFEERADEIGIDPEEMNMAETLAYGETLANIIQEDYENIESGVEGIVDDLETLADHQNLTYGIATANREGLNKIVDRVSRIAEHTKRIDEELEQGFEELYSTIEGAERTVEDLSEKYENFTEDMRDMREEHERNMSDETVSDILDN